MGLWGILRFRKHSVGLNLNFPSQNEINKYFLNLNDLNRKFAQKGHEISYFVPKLNKLGGGH